MSDVRSMLACLANEEVAGVFARIVLHADPAGGLSPARVDKAIAALEHSGLIIREEDQLALARGKIKATLRELAHSTTHDDPAMPWLDSDGRIRQYPRRANDRRELLNRVGRQAITREERIAEPELNSRLERFTSDIPTLRRYLVVHGILAREPDGSMYWRVPG